MLRLKSKLAAAGRRAESNNVSVFDSHSQDATSAEAETSWRENPGTSGQGGLDSSMDRTLSLTAEEQQQQQQQQQEQQQQQQQEEEEERFPAHEACWQGRTEEVQHLLHLDDPDYMENPDQLEEALYQEGSVPLCLNWNHGSHELCPKEYGTLAVLAIKKRRFELANILLGALLFVKILRAPWSDRGCPKWREPGSRHLRKLLWYVGLKHRRDFGCLVSEALVPECTALLTMVAAHVLGDEELAAAVMDTQSTAYWIRVNGIVRLRTFGDHSSGSEKLNETIAIVDACIEGKAACVKLVQKMSPDSRQVLAYERLLPRNTTTVDDLDYFLKSAEIVVELEKCPQSVKKVTPEDLASDLLQEVQVASKKNLTKCASDKRILDILSRVMSLYHSVDPRPKAAEMLHGLASLALYFQAVRGILCGDFTEKLVARCEKGKREAVLESLFQFWVATRSLYKPEITGRQCNFCRQPHTFICRELALKRGTKALETLAQYWTSQDAGEFVYLSRSRGRWNFDRYMCPDCYERLCEDIFEKGFFRGTLEPECKVKPIFEPKVHSLTHLAKLAVLKKMDKERKMFHEFGAPGGVGKMFMVHNFLPEWGYRL